MIDTNLLGPVFKDRAIEVKVSPKTRIPVGSHLLAVSAEALLEYLRNRNKRIVATLLAVMTPRNTKSDVRNADLLVALAQWIASNGRGLSFFSHEISLFKLSQISIFVRGLERRKDNINEFGYKICDLRRDDTDIRLALLAAAHDMPFVTADSKFLFAYRPIIRQFNRRSKILHGRRQIKILS
jgi:hypothetical protein